MLSAWVKKTQKVEVISVQAILIIGGWGDRQFSLNNSDVDDDYNNDDV